MVVVSLPGDFKAFVMSQFWYGKSSFPTGTAGNALYLRMIWQEKSHMDFSVDHLFSSHIKASYGFHVPVLSSHPSMT